MGEDTGESPVLGIFLTTWHRSPRAGDVSPRRITVRLQPPPVSPIYEAEKRVPLAEFFTRNNHRYYIFLYMYPIEYYCRLLNGTVAQLEAGVGATIL